MMDKESFLQSLKASAGMSGGNLLTLGVLTFFGYNSYPVDPDGGEMGVVLFAVMTVIIGGLIPGVAGSLLWRKLDQKWTGRALLIFGGIAFTIATVMTLPVTNPNSPTGDAYVLTAVLHYSTAAFGIWLIPLFASK